MQRFHNDYAVGEEGNSIKKSDFDWNDLSIGNDTMASDGFFRKQHPEHERKDNDMKIIFEDTVMAEENEENILQPMRNRSNSIDSENLSSSLDDVQIASSHNANTHARNGIKQPLATQNASVPQVYTRINADKQRKQLRQEQIFQKEKEARLFRAKPAPKFSEIHASQLRRRQLEEVHITVPKTPNVVGNHRLQAAKIKEKQQKMEEAVKPKPFVSKEADVLLKPAFVPQIKKKTPIQSAPFNLHSDERLRERRQFDQQAKLKKEKEEKELEERRRKDDEEIRKNIRLATTFKANPNPFS